MSRADIFAAFRAAKPDVFNEVPERIGIVDGICDDFGIPRDDRPARTSTLTPRIVAYVASEEGLILEAYQDSVKVWTWALGVTNASGHTVHPRYLDKPQTLEKALEVSVWLMREKYLPAVLRAFPGGLTEAQLAAALSFHWNTGAIERATWVKQWNAGNATAASKSILDWHSKGLLTARRKREQTLFFHGVWPPLTVPVYTVSKPSYTPDWRKPAKVDLLPVLEGMMA